MWRDIISTIAFDSTETSETILTLPLFHREKILQ